MAKLYNTIIVIPIITLTCRNTNMPATSFARTVNKHTIRTNEKLRKFEKTF